MLNILFIDKDARWEKVTFGPDVSCSPHKQITDYDPNAADYGNILANAIFKNSERIWNDQYKEYLHGVDNYQIVIVHTSNAWAEKFFRFRCKDKPTVLFSAGGGISENFKGDREAMALLEDAESRSRFCFVGYDALIKNLNEFLNQFVKLEGLASPPFDVLKHGAVGARVTKAHRLRNDILTPFIALHLALQAHQENRASEIWKIEEFANLNGYRERYASEKEENPLFRFVSLLNLNEYDHIVDGCDKKSFLSKYFQAFFSSPALQNICSKLAKGLTDFGCEEINSCLRNIEVLAHNMEQVVSCIEFDEQPKFQEFRG